MGVMNAPWVHKMIKPPAPKPEARQSYQCEGCRRYMWDDAKLCGVCEAKAAVKRHDRAAAVESQSSLLGFGL